MCPLQVAVVFCPSYTKYPGVGGVNNVSHVPCQHRSIKLTRTFLMYSGLGNTFFIKKKLLNFEFIVGIDSKRDLTQVRTHVA